eukprot:m.34037 g.34037  ORF g.34037 m.34037 type:complete len:309 (+) comp31943_c0_seq1:541-1467(+)
MERLKAALDESPEPEEPTPSPTPPTSPPPPRPRLPPPTQKKIVKFVAPKPKTPSPPPPPPKDPTPPPREPTPPRTPTPPPPPTPIPDFISQFIGESWFDQLFPETSSVNFPKPWTIGHFIDLLLRGLRQSSEMGVKTAIVKALHLLYQQEGFPNKSAVIQTLRSQLNGDQSPNSVLEDDKRFILENLRLLFGLDVADTAFVVELMAQYVDGDEEMREVVTTYFLTMGLDDPNQYFLPRELDSWETWVRASCKKQKPGQKENQLDSRNTSFRIWMKTIARLGSLPWLLTGCSVGLYSVNAIWLVSGKEI